MGAKVVNHPRITSDSTSRRSARGIVVRGAIYGLAMGIAAGCSTGAGHGCWVPALLFASPLAVLGPIGLIYGPVLFYLWVSMALASGKTSVRVPVLLLISYAVAIGFWLSPFGDWERTVRFMSSWEGGSWIWAFLGVYMVGQVWLWRCWATNRRLARMSRETFLADDAGNNHA